MLWCRRIFKRHLESVWSPLALCYLSLSDSTELRDATLLSGLLSGPNRFVLISTKMTWTEAQSSCREHHTDLALVRNMEENQIVQSLNPIEVWIGLFRDPWKWSDGSDSSFRKWNPPEPRKPGGSSETCVAADFSADGRWETLDCKVKRCSCFKASGESEAGEKKLLSGSE
uniref:C-type lectin domain-containing protein n=1 Tax=Cyclopterus lumpus TaxID=8103 RepID=A0A8C2YXT0_CYCLU